MIRIYGGVVTDGLTDGVEVGTQENPIVFDGLYPAPNGEASKELYLAVRTDGEKYQDVCIIVARLNNDGIDIDKSGSTYRFGGGYNYAPFLYKKDKILKINPQTLLFKELNNTNQTFSIVARASGTEDTTIMPDLRGKLYIIFASDIMNKV